MLLSHRARALMGLTDTATLWTLFASSFLAATLLPGGSEVVLFAVLKQNAGIYWPALAVATLGNTLGGMSSFLVGRLVPQSGHLRDARALDWIKTHGSPILLLSWVPLIGDPLCAAAGWLRINPWWAMLFMAVGKFARYLVIAGFAY